MKQLLVIVVQVIVSVLILSQDVQSYTYTPTFGFVPNKLTRGGIITNSPSVTISQSFQYTKTTFDVDTTYIDVTATIAVRQPCSSSGVLSPLVTISTPTRINPNIPVPSRPYNSDPTVIGVAINSPRNTHLNIFYLDFKTVGFLINPIAAYTKVCTPLTYSVQFSYVASTQTNNNNTYLYNYTYPSSSVTTLSNGIDYEYNVTSSFVNAKAFGIFSCLAINDFTIPTPFQIDLSYHTIGSVIGGVTYKFIGNSAIDFIIVVNSTDTVIIQQQQLLDSSTCPHESFGLYFPATVTFNFHSIGSLLY